MVELLAILGVILLVIATVVVPLIWRAGAGASTVGGAEARTGTQISRLQVAPVQPKRSPRPLAESRESRAPEPAGDPFASGERDFAAVEGDFAAVEGIEGRIDRSALRKMRAIVDRHPDEALSVVRRWMEEDR